MLRSATKSSAFTLLEMLLALALMSILAGSLYASLHIAFRSRDSALAAIEPLDKAAVALEMLREDIEAALPPNGILAAEFVGQDGQDDAGRDADTLALYSSAGRCPPGQTASDVRRVEFSVESSPDEQEGTLVRRVTSILLAPEVYEPEAEVLCRGVRAVQLRYFDGSAWQDNWDSVSLGNVLPLAVEATLEVQRPRAGAAGTEGYRLSRVFLLPCAIPPEEGTTTVGSVQTGP